MHFVIGSDIERQRNEHEWLSAIALTMAELHGLECLAGLDVQQAKQVKDAAQM